MFNYKDILKKESYVWYDKRGKAEAALKVVEEKMHTDLGAMDFIALRRELSKMLEDYKSARAKSWRSWWIFRDETRDEHMNQLQATINNLSSHNILSCLDFLANEKNYADSKNGKHYKTLLTTMSARIKKNIGTIVAPYLGKMASLKKEMDYYENEATRIINKIRNIF